MYPFEKGVFLLLAPQPETFFPRLPEVFSDQHLPSGSDSRLSHKQHPLLIQILVQGYREWQFPFHNLKFPISSIPQDYLAAIERHNG